MHFIFKLDLFSGLICRITRTEPKVLSFKKLMKERRKIANRFNRTYTYTTPYEYQTSKWSEELRGTRFGGYAWMCPQCNAIHLPVRFDIHDGIQYPPCCGTPYGHRRYLHCGVERNPGIHCGTPEGWKDQSYTHD